MNDEQLAAELVRLAGGRENLTGIDMCFTRLRLELVDPAVVDVDGIEAIPEVAMTFTQAGQFQIVLGRRVRKVYAAVAQLAPDLTADEKNDDDRT